MEVRQRPRPTGQQWFESKELNAYLDAFGDDSPSLPETIRVLDSIAVDFIIETCYAAESHARYAGRQKVKVDDFQFALRNDPKKLGRMQELLEKDKLIKRKRKAFDIPEGNVGKMAKGALNEEGTPKKRGRGRRKKAEIEAEANGDGGDGDLFGDGDEGSLVAEGGKKNKKRRKSGGGSVVRQEIGEDDVDLDDGDDD